MARIGVDSVYYARLTSDTFGGTPTYQTPVALPGVSEMNINPNSSSTTLFLDDGPSDTAITIGEGEVAFMVGELAIAERATLLGHTVVGGVLQKDARDVPPFVAIGFKSLKSDGSYRYYWFTKVKFREPEMNHSTRGETIDFQLDSMTGALIKRQSDSIWQYAADEGQANVPQSTLDDWFTSVPGSSPDVTAPTVQTIVPADDATGIAVGTTIVVTFSEAMDKNTLIPSNFILQAAETDINYTLTYDTAGVEVTLTPDANLAAATEHNVIVTTAVQDLSGNNLANNFASSFTTA